MARKSKTPSFEQILDALRARSFEVTQFKGVEDVMQLSKGGVEAVVVPQGTNAESERANGGNAGVLVSEIARLLDRGYQDY